MLITKVNTVPNVEPQALQRFVPALQSPQFSRKQTGIKIASAHVMLDVKSGSPLNSLLSGEPGYPLPSGSGFRVASVRGVDPFFRMALSTLRTDDEREVVVRFLQESNGEKVGLRLKLSPEDVTGRRRLSIAVVPPVAKSSLRALDPVLKAFLPAGTRTADTELGQLIASLVPGVEFYNQ